MPISSTHNINQRFVDEISQRMEADDITNFLEKARRPLKKSITINTAKISVEDFIAITQVRGWTLTAPAYTHERMATFYIDRENLDLALGNSFLHQSGFFYIQEVAASSSAPNLDLKSGDLVLDMASAPGGKTSQLANMLLQNAHLCDENESSTTPGTIVANDVNGKRITHLAHNLNRGGCYNTCISKFNGGSYGKNLPDFFDHVLLDAPCSGEGTGFKSDFALKHRKIEEINKIAGTQFQLLVSAIKTCKPGGTIVYSTCTINPHENEFLLEKVIEFFGGGIEICDLHVITGDTGFLGEKFDDDRSRKYTRCRPHKQGTGGFFVSKLRKSPDLISRKDSNKKHNDHKLLPRNQFKLTTSKKIQTDVSTYLKKHFDITIDPTKHFFASTKEKVYLCSPDITKILPHIHLEKVGIPILKNDRLLQYRPTHYLGNILGHLANKHTIELTDKQAQTYSQGKNIPLAQVSIENTSQKYHILTWRGKGFSTAKIVNEELKNKFGK